MPITIQMWDEVIPGPRRAAPSVSLDGSVTTARDLIRERVRQEVERYNTTLPELFQGLVQPEESERLLNGFRMKAARPLDWAVQFQRACSSFEGNGFLMIVDGRQVSELDQMVEVRTGSEVQFVKLVPLVGG